MVGSGLILRDDGAGASRRPAADRGLVGGPVAFLRGAETAETSFCALSETESSRFANPSRPRSTLPHIDLNVEDNAPDGCERLGARNGWGCAGR